MFKLRSILGILVIVAFVCAALGTVAKRYYSASFTSETPTEMADNRQSESLPEPDNRETHSAKAKQMESAASSKENTSVLKTSSNFVTVFYVLINYMFSGPMESQTMNSL